MSIIKQIPQPTSVANGSFESGWSP